MIVPKNISDLWFNYSLFVVLFMDVFSAVQSAMAQDSSQIAILELLEERELLEKMVGDSILLGVDLTLLHLYRPESDPYSEATKYYRPQLAQRRRGVDWWLVDEVVEPLQRVDKIEQSRVEQSRLRTYGSTEGYNWGLEVEHASSSSRGWSRYFDVNARIGEDLNIMGVFHQDLRAEAGISQEFERGDYLSIDLKFPLLMQGLQSDASQEAITLTGDNLYNPAWGFYDGEVRNSRVSKYAIPEVEAIYIRPIGTQESTKLIARMNGEYGRRSISRLGWYDAYNPSPDYYRKLPSYVDQSDTQSEIEQLWRSEDSEYTQINWDALILQNQLSSDGEAHYIVEDQVEWRSGVDLSLILVSEVGDGVELIYGAQGELSSDRHFKEMVDLLGAEFLTDHDLYIGDNVHLGTEMQNDLRNPDRKIVEGDRFGYDYTLNTIDIKGVVGVEYRNDLVNLALRGEFGQRETERIGHYEKERFAGSLSYGASSKVTLPSNRVDVRVGYSPTGRHHITFEGLYHQLPVDDSDLFIQVQCANQVIDNPTSRTLSSASAGYRYQQSNFTLDAELYILYSRNATQVWSYYDDLSYTYSNVVIDGIGSRSMGVEIVTNWQIGHKLNWDVALSMGSYTYDTTPTVTLYDDQDMTLLSTSEATAINGCKVGNAPQILVTSSLDYFVDYGLILSLDCSYGGSRYIAPSFVRRTDRVICAADSPEMVSEIVDQERLGDLFDVTLGVTKSYWLRRDRRISVNARVNNLLGDVNQINYGRESNRILTTSGGSDVGSRYVEGSSYIYNAPRTLRLSCSYTF